MTQTSPETDLQVLVTLYDATNGQYWQDNKNWMSGLPIGEWKGVITDDNGRVTSLYLGKNNLRGEIPPELGNLANLEDLRLRENQLSGDIPPELGNLENLTVLLLYLNKLSGDIPPELGNLGNLTNIRLERN